MSFVFAIHQVWIAHVHAPFLMNPPCSNVLTLSRFVASFRWLDSALTHNHSLSQSLQSLCPGCDVYEPTDSDVYEWWWMTNVSEFLCKYDGIVRCWAVWWINWCRVSPPHYTEVMFCICFAGSKRGHPPQAQGIPPKVSSGASGWADPGRRRS